MSYYDPEYYDEKYCDAQDKTEIRFWRTLMGCACDNVVDEYEEIFDEFPGQTMSTLASEIATGITRKVKEYFEDEIRDYVVSRLDEYGEEKYAMLKAAADAEDNKENERL